MAIEKRKYGDKEKAGRYCERAVKRIDSGEEKK